MEIVGFIDFYKFMTLTPTQSRFHEKADAQH